MEQEQGIKFDVELRNYIRLLVKSVRALSA